MRRIAAVGALVGVMAVVTGCWPIGPIVGRPPEVTPAPVGPTPVASPWVLEQVLIVQLAAPDGGPISAEQLATAEQVVAARLAALGGSGMSVRAIPDDRLRIELADAAVADAVTHVATAPGDLQFMAVPPAFANEIMESEPLPPDMPVRSIFGGDFIVSFELGADQTGQPAIDLQLDDEAAEAFDDFAAANIGNRFAIVLDGLVLSAPVLRQGDFDGRAQVSGPFDIEQTRQLIAILEGGALPVEATVLTVCPAADGCAASSPGPSTEAP